MGLFGFGIATGGAQTVYSGGTSDFNSGNGAQVPQDVTASQTVESAPSNAVGSDTGSPSLLSGVWDWMKATYHKADFSYSNTAEPGSGIFGKITESIGTGIGNIVGGVTKPLVTPLIIIGVIAVIALVIFVKVRE